MADYLVLAHQTATDPLLLDRLKRIVATDPAARFTLLVPATPVHHLLLFKGSEAEATQVAGDLVTRAGAAWQEAGLPAPQGRVGSADPLAAIDQEVTAHPGHAGIVISTLPEEHSRWLLLDLPKKAEAKYDIPIYHVLTQIEIESDFS